MENSSAAAQAAAQAATQAAQNKKMRGERLAGGTDRLPTNYDPSAARWREGDDNEMFKGTPDRLVVRTWTRELAERSPPATHTGTCHFDDIDDAVLNLLINYGMRHAETGLQPDEPDGEERRDLLGPVELLLLQCVCKRFSRVVAACPRPSSSSPPPAQLRLPLSPRP